MIKNPEIFVVQQLPVEFVHEQIHMFWWAELLKRQFYQFDAAGNTLRQALKSLAGKSCHEWILLDGIYFAGCQARQLSSKQARAAASLDTHSTDDELSMRSEQRAVGACAL